MMEQRRKGITEIKNKEKKRLISKKKSTGEERELGGHKNFIGKGRIMVTQAERK